MLIRLPEVLKMVPVGKTTWYGMVKAQQAPAPKKIGPRSVAWVKEEIEKWIENRPSVLTTNRFSGSD